MTARAVDLVLQAGELRCGTGAWSIPGPSSPGTETRVLDLRSRGNPARLRL